jgi:aminoglycoside phosphotransferase
VLNGFPDSAAALPVALPAALRAVVGDRPFRPVWVNVLGGTTFEINPDEYDRSLAKFAPAGSGHGDACAPNTLIGDDGTWTGHVDLARLGVADRWADLAIAPWSIGWNFGDGWDAAFFDAYQIEPDPARIAYYRLLWDCTL